MDQKKICNYGHVRYLTDATGIRKLKKPFYNRVKNLPKEYNIHDYMQFLRDWGTVSCVIALLCLIYLAILACNS